MMTPSGPIKLFTAKMSDALLEGKKRFEERIQAQSDKETGAAPHRGARHRGIRCAGNVETKGAEPESERTIPGKRRTG